MVNNVENNGKSFSFEFKWLGYVWREWKAQTQLCHSTCAWLSHFVGELGVGDMIGYVGLCK